MSISRKHASPFIRSVLPVLFLALAHPALGTPQVAGASASTSGPMAAERQIPLAWSKADQVQLQAVASAWQPVARVKFLSAASGPAETRQDNMIRTGALSWNVTPAGTQVLDNRTGSTATIPGLTSNEVRPRDMVYDKQTGTVWFYGDNLYRYQFASHILEQMRLSVENWQVIRKAAMGQAGMWLAAGNGIYLLDAADGALKRVQHPLLAGKQFINVASGEREAWFATADARLVRIGLHAPGMPASARFGLAVSAAMPGAPAELVAAGQTVWMLLSEKHGDYYKLAFVDERQERLGMMQGKYFSLSEKEGQLTASAYAMLFRIDPANKTATPVKPVEAGLLAHSARNESVLYAGLSYGYKDGCEVVEHGQPDISKGWTTAMGDPVFR
jgi:hypothetical protein